jgi:cell division protease FtsH
MNNNINKNDNGQGGDGKKPKTGQTFIVILIAFVVTILAMTFLSDAITGSTTKKIKYTDFLTMIENDQIESVSYESDKIVITPKNQPYEGLDFKYYTGYAEDTTKITERLSEHNIPVDGYIPDTNSSILDFIMMYILPFIFIYIMFSFVFGRISKGGGVMGVGKSTAKMYMEKETGVTFKDVAGQDEAKESMTEIVDFLHNPDKYSKIGAKLPKGALLVGPPGTGKTLLAKAVAGEAKVPFFSLSGSDFVEMFVGVGASRVRDLFKQAQASAPCIIFIDEIDAIGKSRDSKYGGGNDEREQTLNQLLAEMDGFDTSKGIFILAATNRPDVLDKALLRPGRLDRRIIVDKPDLKGRIETLKVHSKDVLMDDTVDLEEIAKATSGAVGSDLANMINEAAINAVKEGRNVVSQKDLFESVEVVIAGKEKKDRVLSSEEKKIVAYHESGHALITCLKKNAEPVQKITIVPRTKGSLGYVMQVPEEEKYLMSKEEMITDITTFCGGRAAEEIVFGSITTGASNDIERATNMAKSMITRYGMSDEFGFMGLATVENQYLDASARLDCSPATEKAVDEEVKKLLNNCYSEARKLLLENRDVLDKVAVYLFEKETITGKQFMDIYNEVKGITPEHESDI